MRRFTLLVTIFLVMASCAVAQIPNRFLPPQITGKDSMQATSGAFDVLYVGGSPVTTGEAGIYVTTATAQTISGQKTYTSVQEFTAGGGSIKVKEIRQSGSTYLDIKQSDTLNGIRMFIGLTSPHVTISDDVIRLQKTGSGKVEVSYGDVELRPASGGTTRLKDGSGADQLTISSIPIFPNGFDSDGDINLGADLVMDDDTWIYGALGAIDYYIAGPFSLMESGLTTAIRIDADVLVRQDMRVEYPKVIKGVAPNDLILKGPMSVQDSGGTTQIRVASIPAFPNGLTSQGETVLTSATLASVGGGMTTDTAQDVTGSKTFQSDQFFRTIRGEAGQALTLRGASGQNTYHRFGDNNTAILIPATQQEVQFGKGLSANSNLAAGVIGVRANAQDASKALLVSAGNPSAGQIDNLAEIQVSGKTLPANWNGNMLNLFKSGNTVGAFGFTKAMLRCWDNDAYDASNTGPLAKLQWTNVHSNGRPMLDFTLPSGEVGGGYLWKIGGDFGSTLTFTADTDGNMVTDGDIELDGDLVATSGNVEVQTGLVDIQGANGYLKVLKSSGGVFMVDLTGQTAHNARILNIQQHTSSTSEIACFVDHAGPGYAVFARGKNNNANSIGVYGTNTQALGTGIKAENTGGGWALDVSGDSRFSVGNGARIEDFRRISDGYLYMEFSALNRMLFHVVPQIEAGAIHNNNAPLNFHYTSLDSPFILMNNDNDTGWFTGTASAKTIVYKFDNNDVIELSNTGVAIPVWDLDIDSGDLVMGAGDIDLAAAGTQLVAARSSGGGSGAPIWMSMSGTWNGRMVELNNTNAANNQFNLFVTTNGGGAAGYFYNSGSGASARGIYARAANAAVPALYAVNNAAGVAADIEGDVDHLGDYDLDGDLTVLTGGNLNITNGNVIAAGSQFSWTGSTRFKGDAQFWNSAATSNRINWVASTESFGTGLGGYYAAGNRTLWTFTGEAASTDASDLFLDVDANRRIVMGTNVVASGSAVITWPVIKAGLALEAVDNGTDPATPAAGVGRFYTKTDEPWYIDDGGNAKKLTALPTNHLHGFGISVSVASPLTEVVLDVGEARSSDDSSDMTTATTIALDLTTNGVNALDTGSEASSTWYYVWVIHNPTTKVTQGLISASSTSPTLPSGYTKSLRVGTFRNDASSNIIPFKQGGHSHSRTYIYLSSFSSRNVLTTGAATSTTQVDVSSFVPPVSFSADLTITNLSGTRTIFYQTTNGGTIIMEIIEGSTSYSNAPLDTDQSFWYYNDGAAGDANAWVRGWRESL